MAPQSSGFLKRDSRYDCGLLEGLVRSNSTLAIGWFIRRSYNYHHLSSTIIYVHNDSVYPPIHPTKFSDGQPEWSRDHAVVYELVLRHFLACVSQPCIESVTTFEIKISGESFVASEGVIIHEGFLSVYTYDKVKKGSLKVTRLQKVTRLPKYKKEEKDSELELFDGLTSAPDCASEADVLTWMDKEKISTGSTMHVRIEKLIEQSYVDVDQSYATMSGLPRKLIPTRIAKSNEDKLCKAMDMFFGRSNSSRTYPDLEVKKDETILTYQSGKWRKRQTSDGEKQGSFGLKKKERMQGENGEFVDLEKEEYLYPLTN